MDNVNPFTSGNGPTAEEIFATFFGGQDPFVAMFQELNREQRGTRRVHFSTFGPGIRFQRVSMPHNGFRTSHRYST